MNSWYEMVIKDRYYHAPPPGSTGRGLTVYTTTYEGKGLAPVVLAKIDRDTDPELANTAQKLVQNSMFGNGDVER